MEDEKVAESTRRKIDCHDELELALEARERFLKDHPDLQPFQDEIDRILADVVEPENRMKALTFLLQKKLCELHDSIADLLATVGKQHNSARNANLDAFFNNRQNPGDYLN